ncbi:MAG TPA: hypothetical protein VMU32_12700 [Solirubrobacteraceae bacterium]|nr:hypothetical protein [Solirubrobacteraceae bacterium]
MSASFAAMSAAGACPAANATSNPTTSPQAAGKHHAPQRRPATSRRGPYVYAVTIGGEISTQRPNARCSSNAIRLTSIALRMSESRAAEALANRDPSFWTKRVTITLGAATAVTMPWNSAEETREAEEHEGAIPNGRETWATAPAGRICAATTPDAVLGSVGEGVITWRLHTPVNTVAALLSNAPATFVVNELMAAFAVQPNGTVPRFAA